MTDKTDHGTTSTVAILCYAGLTIFLATIIGIFWIILAGVKIDGPILPVLGTILAIEGSFLSAISGFWLASSVGARANSAAIAQLAGAGPQPPEQPLGEPK